MDAFLVAKEIDDEIKRLETFAFMAQTKKGVTAINKDIQKLKNDKRKVLGYHHIEDEQTLQEYYLNKRRLLYGE